MAEEKEVNTQSVQKTMDEFFDAKDTAQETNSPESDQTAKPDENVDDTVKTGKSEGEAVGEDGKLPESIPYARFQEIVKQNKEAQGKLKELESSNSVYSRLLDDPFVYRKYLEAQGFNKEEVTQAMAQRGFEEERQAPRIPDSAPKPLEIADEVCKKLGWDISRLNQEQKDYLKDQIALSQALFERFIGPVLKTHIEPVQNFMREQVKDREISRGYEEAKSLAKEEFPDLDWSKDIEPAMSRYLDQLDKRDPKHRIQIDAITLYERATRQILKEKKESGVRQEERNELKKNARPLTPGVSPNKAGSALKGKTVKETAENFLTSIGFKE